MTPQDIDNLQNAINSLQSAVNGLAGTTGVVGSSLNNFNGSVLNSAQQARTAGQSFQMAGQNIVAGSMSVAGAQQQAAREIQQQSAQMAAAGQTLRSQLAQATNALTTSTGNLNNAAGASSTLGTALGMLAQKVGAPAAAAESLGNLFSNLGNVILGQTQALLSARDSLYRLGAVGQQTASSLYSYAHAAGLHSDTIGRMITPITTLGPALLTLGRGAGDAQKAFMELVQVGEDNRRQFANIGIFQEDMMRLQGNYVAAQDAAGINLRLQNTDMAKLRTASLEYIKNLYELSALTGEEVSTTEKRMRAAREEPLNQIENILRQREAQALRADADRLEQEGNLAEAAAKRREAQDIENQIAFRNAIQDQLSGLPEFVRKGVLEMETREGVISPENQAAYMLNLQDIYNRAKEEATTGKNANLAPEQQAKVLRDILNKELFGTEGAAYKTGRELEQAIQLNPQLMNQLLPADVRRALAQGQADDSARIRADAADQIRFAMKDGADSAGKIAAALQEVAITYGQLLDRAKTKIPGSPIEAVDINNVPTNALETARDRLRRPDYPGKTFEDKLNELAVADKLLTSGITELTGPVQKIADAVTGGKLSELLNAITPQRTLPSDPTKARVLPPEPNIVNDQGQVVIPGRPQPIGSEILRKKPIVYPTTPATTEPQTQPPAATTEPQTQPPSPPPQTPPDRAGESNQPNFTDITVETNLGTTLQVNNSVVAKVAGFIRQSSNRDRFLRPKVKLALSNAGAENAIRFDNKTVDTIIDKAAQQANLPIPPGSEANNAPNVEPNAPPAPPQVSNVADLIQSGKLQTETPASVASKIATPKTRQGAVNTSLSKLIDTGIIDPKYIRGPQEIPTNIVQKGKTKVADDSDPKTRDTQGEGYALDPKLLESVISLQNTDLGELTLQHITALNDYYHALNFKDSSHREGRAVDFTLNKAPTTEQSAKIINILKGIGFNKVLDEYNNPSPNSAGKHFHAEVPKQELPELDMGGLVRGPKSGFPAMLHGNEMVIPLSPDSLLAELGRKSVEQFTSENKTSEQQKDMMLSTNFKDDLLRANEIIAKVLTNKLDEVILKLDMGNQTSNKILRSSQV